MASPPTARSLPPPALPATLVAQTRLRLLAAELDAAESDTTRAVLSYEIGALHEHRLGDARASLDWYARARDLDRGFRPALLALLRLRPALDATEQLAGLWEVAAELAPTPEERALALVEQGLALHEAYGASRDALALWERALAVEPSCQAAALLLERHHRAEGRSAEADHAALLRAEATADAGLRAELVLELAERTGDVGHLLSLLDALGSSAFDGATLERMAEILQRAEKWRELVGVLGERARTADAATAAALLREMGRISAQRLGDPGGAKAAYARALVLLPGDALILTEQAELARRAGDLDGEIQAIGALLAAGGDGGHGALLELRLAELAQARGDDAGERAAVERAVALAPGAARTLSAYEDALVRDGRFDALCEHLVRRAQTAPAGARAERLRQAGWLALDALGDAERGATLFADALESAGDGALALAREAYGAALLAGNVRARRRSVERLAAESDDSRERAELAYERYCTTVEGEPEEAEALLADALGAPEHAGWAPYAARVEALLRGRPTALARAHDALADAAATEADALVAHGCAAARALVRAGDLAGAVERLRTVLARRPGDAYAVALLEEALLAKGETREAVRVLVDAAHTRAHRERALLQAGVAAEASGDWTLARRSYEQAAEESPEALSPAWALRRLAERGKDGPALLEALERLARRERALGRGESAALELAEHYDTLDEPARAAPWLARALDDDTVASAAALDLALTSAAGDDDPTRERARERLRARGAPALANALARETSMRTPSAGDRAGLVLAGAAEDDTWAGWVALCAADDAAGLARAFDALADAAGAGEVGAELRLHAARSAALVARASAEATTQALVAERGDSLEASLARDEALGASAEERAGALFARLAHAGPSSAPSLRAARARALLDAGRPREAADGARREIAAMPDALDAWEVMLGAAHELDDWETLVEAADRLAASLAGHQRAALLELSAVTLADELDRPADAEARLRDALDADPTRTTAFDRLHDLLVAREDFQGLLSLLDRRAASVADDAARVELVWESALVERARARRDAALTRLDHVLAIDPQHTGALGLRAEIHTSLRQWHDAVAALRALARAPVPAAQKRLAHLGAADFLERRLQDPAGAYAELAALVEASLAPPATHERMARLAELAGMNAEAARAYEAAAETERGAARASLERKAGALHDALGASERAAAAYARALDALPTDVDALEELVPYLEPEQYTERLVRMRDEILRSLVDRPADPASLRALRRVGKLSGEVDLEHASLGALYALGIADGVESRAWEARAPRSAIARGVMLAPGEIDALRAGAALGPAAELCAFANDTSVHEARTPMTATSDGSGPALSDELASLLALFDLELERLVPAAPGDGARIEPQVAPGRSHVWEHGSAVRAPLSAVQRFAVGRHAMALHMHAAVLLASSTGERLDGLRAAIALATGTAPDDRSRVRARELERRLSRAARKALREVVERLDDPLARAEQYLQAVRTSALRAGLVCADDPAAALSAVLGATPDLAGVRASPEALEVLRFWVSPLRLALARRLRGENEGAR